MHVKALDKHFANPWIEKQTSKAPEISLNDPASSFWSTEATLHSFSHKKLFMWSFKSYLKTSDK